MSKKTFILFYSARPKMRSQRFKSTARLYITIEPLNALRGFDLRQNLELKTFDFSKRFVYFVVSTSRWTHAQVVSLKCCTSISNITCRLICVFTAMLVKIIVLIWINNKMAKFIFSLLLKTSCIVCKCWLILDYTTGNQMFPPKL